MILNYVARMMNFNKLETLNEVVNALGGNREAAVFWGISEQQVCNMKKDGKLLRHHQFETDMYLRSKGYSIDHEAVFGSSLRLLKEKLRERQYAGIACSSGRSKTSEMTTAA